MKALKYLPLVLLLSACSGGIKTSTTDTTKVAATDTNLFDSPVAVEIWPSSRLIDKWKKRSSNGERFYVTADDNNYYMAQSTGYLDSVKIRRVRRESEGELKFKAADGNIYAMKLDTIFFGVMLFSGKDKPVMADITDIGDDVGKYMKK